MYSKYSNNIKKIVAFTLVELIIVIAIISLLAAIVIVVINPSSLFASGRNATRSNDINTIKDSINRYLADYLPGGTPRSLNDFSGYAALYAGATIINQSVSPGYSGRCNGSQNGVVNPVTGAYGLDTISGININLYNLVSNGYLTKVPKDPQSGNAYQACIDTTNNNQLVIFAVSTEIQTTYDISTSINTTGPAILAWDSFDRANNSGLSGTSTDNGKVYGGSAMSVNSNTAVPAFSNRASLVDLGKADATISMNIISIASNGGGPGFRGSDDTHEIFVSIGSTSISLQYRVVSTVTTLSGPVTLSFSPNELIKVKLSGSNIFVYVNDVLQISYSDVTTGYNANTQYGLYSGATGTITADNFVVTNN